jgi:uncharacterized protein (DUF486 family)
LLLIGSNVFMTLAWYGHLKFKQAPLLLVVVLAWLIALPEYCLQVPANRLGHDAGLTAPQLKILQEVISIAVFAVFTSTYLGEAPRWNEWLAFALIVGAVALIALGGRAPLAVR